MAACELCDTPGGTVIWQSADCRVVRVADPHYPGFCRVIWREHVREMTDLSPEQRQCMMGVVFAVEGVVRDILRPDKVNLASFGNMTPHLHWHVIPRWRDDRHFPEPVWGKVQREQTGPRPDVDDGQLQSAIAHVLSGYAK
jgi:diadenosine tetraphosphate (Ap4A) HIT family hydrolase